MQEYGKGFPKSVGVSPDAYIQMAIQTTYRRMAGKFGLTYEASRTRRVREGRTETVRSVSQEMTDFIRAYMDPNVDDLARMKLMRIASDRHTVSLFSSLAPNETSPPLLGRTCTGRR